MAVKVLSQQNRGSRDPVLPPLISFTAACAFSFTIPSYVYTPRSIPCLFTLLYGHYFLLYMQIYIRSHPDLYMYSCGKYRDAVKELQKETVFWCKKSDAFSPNPVFNQTLHHISQSATDVLRLPKDVIYRIFGRSVSNFFMN